MNKERLLSVAKALRESEHADKFTMCQFHTCGTPQCAMGHYAARRDLQNFVQLDINAKNDALLFGVWGATRRVNNVWQPISSHFDLTRDQTLELFDMCGCGNARSPNEAAEYIERFVAESR